MQKISKCFTIQRRKTSLCLVLYWVTSLVGCQTNPAQIPVIQPAGNELLRIDPETGTVQRLLEFSEESYVGLFDSSTGVKGIPHEVEWSDFAFDVQIASAHDTSFKSLMWVDSCTGRIDEIRRLYVDDLKDRDKAFTYLIDPTDIQRSVKWYHNSSRILEITNNEDAVIRIELPDLTSRLAVSGNYIVYKTEYYNPFRLELVLYDFIANEVCWRMPVDAIKQRFVSDPVLNIKDDLPIHGAIAIGPEYIVWISQNVLCRIRLSDGEIVQAIERPMKSNKIGPPITEWDYPIIQIYPMPNGEFGLVAAYEWVICCYDWDDISQVRWSHVFTEPDPNYPYSVNLNRFGIGLFGRLVDKKTNTDN